MDANNFFANRQHVPLASFQRSQFGFSLGGPVVLPRLYDGRNKTFFFVDYEGLRQRTAANVLGSVPTLAERSGDFSQLRTAAGQPITIYDPKTTTLVGGTYIRQPFLNNVIPQNRIDTVAAAVAKYWPLPNVTGTGGGQINNWVASTSAPYNIDQYDIKIDQNIGTRQRLAFRISQRKPSLQPTLFFPSAIAIAQSSNSTVHNGATLSNNAIGGGSNYVLTLTPTDIVELRYGVSRVVQNTQIISHRFDPTQLGFPTILRRARTRWAFPASNSRTITRLDREAT